MQILNFSLFNFFPSIFAGQESKSCFLLKIDFGNRFLQPTVNLECLTVQRVFCNNFFVTDNMDNCMVSLGFMQMTHFCLFLFFLVFWLLLLFRLYS